jgi:hypothetical protein
MQFTLKARGFGKLKKKNSMTSSALEPMLFQLVA